MLIGVLVAVILLLGFTGPELGLGGTSEPVGGVDQTDREAAAAAQEFRRLLAESRRDEDSAPLPGTWVTGAGGLLNPCVNALTERRPELEPIEKVGARLKVCSVTSRTATSAVVPEDDISPHLDRAISIALERVGDGVQGWRVRQLNKRDLPL